MMIGAKRAVLGVVAGGAATALLGGRQHRRWPDAPSFFFVFCFFVCVWGVPCSLFPFRGGFGFCFLFFFFFFFFFFSFFFFFPSFPCFLGFFLVFFFFLFFFVSSSFFPVGGKTLRLAWF